MTIKGEWLALVALVIVTRTPAYAPLAPIEQPRQTVQPTPPSHEEVVKQELARRALREVASDLDYIALYRMKEELGDELLPYCAEARFDPDVKIRRAALAATTSSYKSLLYLLPMTQDTDRDVVKDSFNRITETQHSRAHFQKLDAAEVVRLVKSAMERHPDLVRQVPQILLLLSEFPGREEVQGLVNQLIRANQWNASPKDTETFPRNRDLVIALVARCQVGSITADQVIRVLRANPSARKTFSSYINLLTNETLLHYALSLLYDTTLVSAGNGSDVPEDRVYFEAAFSASYETGIKLAPKMINGIPQYDKADIEKLYRYYGLKM